MAKIYEFHWKAVDRFQQKRKGRLLSSSREELESTLLAKGYEQIRVSRNFVFSQNPKKRKSANFYPNWHC